MTDKYIFTTVYEQDSFVPVARIVERQAHLQEQAKIAEDKQWQELENYYLGKKHKQRLEHQTQVGIRIYHYHNDHLGTPQELTNNLGEVVWLNYSQAWGGSYETKCFAQELDNLDVSADVLQPLRFQGQFFDTETSFHYNRFRYYDSDVGMFISRDPIQLEGGLNTFTYAPNPVMWIDPLGLVKLRPTDPPLGSLNNKLVRCWYKREESKINDIVNCCRNKQQQARLAHKLRNEARIRARLLMSDRDEAKALYTGINSPTNKAEPMLTWKQTVQKAKSKGLQGDAIYDYIIGSSQRSRKEIDAKAIGDDDCEELLKKAGI